MREREVDPQVKVTDLDVDQFLHEQQGSTDGSGLEINLAQVLVVVPEGASDAQVKTLQARETEWGGNAIERMSRRYGNYDIAKPGIV